MNDDRAQAPNRNLIAAGVAIFAVVVGVVIGRCSAPEPRKPPASVMVVKPTPAVITALRDLARLESAEYHIERVIDLKDKQTHFFGLIEAEDALLLVAAGDVVAGVDLGTLKEGDVVAEPDKKRVTIRLPEPEILSSRIDNEHTYVHMRTTELLAKRKENLESEARKEAEKSIVDAAKEQGILDRAKRNSQNTIEKLVRSLGYSEVTVEFRGAPAPKPDR